MAKTPAQLDREIAKALARESKSRKFTNTQILEMCKQPWMWITELTAAAKGMPGITSVTPINMVVQALRAKYEGK